MERFESLADGYLDWRNVFSGKRFPSGNLRPDREQNKSGCHRGGPRAYRVISNTDFPVVFITRLAEALWAHPKSFNQKGAILYERFLKRESDLLSKNRFSIFL